MMKKLTIAIYLTALLCGSIAPVAVAMAASGDYIPLAPLPGTYEGTEEEPTTDLGIYISGVFKLAIALAGLFAVIRIVWGGITYMSTDAISGKSSGKEIISGAVYGLLLAIASFLIMSTINSSLLGGRDGEVLDLNIDIPAVNGNR